MPSTPTGQAWKQIREGLQLLLHRRRLTLGGRRGPSRLVGLPPDFDGRKQQPPRTIPSDGSQHTSGQPCSPGITFDSESLGFSITFLETVKEPSCSIHNARALARCLRLPAPRPQAPRGAAGPATGRKMPAAGSLAALMGQGRPGRERMEFYAQILLWPVRIFSKSLQLSRSFPFIVQWKLYRKGKFK